MRVIGRLEVISSGGWFSGPHVLHRTDNCEENAGPCHGSLFAYHWVRKAAEIRENGQMSSRQTYRVSAYNTSKLSENKIHDDTVARRFGFSGGLVPGVDVMAYMMHLPVEKWGRAFLERGLIEARFVKPVYDGEIAELVGEVSAGWLSIEGPSRGH